MKTSPKPFRFTVCFILLAAFISFGSLGCKPKKQEAPPPPPTPTPVIPPGSIVFVQRGHLVRFDLDSSQTTPLTSGKSTEWFPACSPKGDQVAYWSNAEGGIYNIWKVNMDGSNRLQLTFDEANGMGSSDQNLLMNNSPAWSSDGKKIIYSLEGDIWTMDSDGFNPETLLSGQKALCPSYSPDGKSILYLCMGEDPVFNLWTMNLSDRTPKKLTNYSDWNIGSPSFSADGKKILFNLYRENQTQVYTAAADGTNLLNITNNNRSLCPRFAQNDRKILYCSSGTGEDVGLTLYLANANGTDAKALPPDNVNSPSWAPAPVIAAPTPTAGASQPSFQTTSSAKPISQIPLPTPIGK
jgi:Tol biopolymer transport system component